MPKYVQSQSRKLMSAYGGVGSIIETTKGALEVEPFDKWKFFDLNKNKFNDNEYLIEDNRLLKRLKIHFTKLQKFIGLPSNVANHNISNESIPLDLDKVASAKYFPRWMYCPNCDKFKNISDWWKGWKSVMDKYRINDASEKFIKPKCFHCFDDAKVKSKKRFNYELEQVRFIMTSPNGEMKDIPWDRWNMAEKNVKEEDADGGSVKLNYENLCCETPNLKYLRSETFSDLAGIRIKCINPDCITKGREVSLAGLFGLRQGNEKDKLYKPVIRTSNSVYYPLTINSIYLPKKMEDIKESDKLTIVNLFNHGVPIETIAISFSVYQKQTIIDFLSKSDDEIFEPELHYRLKEYNFISENPNYSDGKKSNLTYENQDTSILIENGLSSLIKIKRLKLTSVQTGYTRQEPLDKDLFLKDGNEKSPIKLKYTSTQGPNTEILLANESYGEGIFIDLDKTKLKLWYETNTQKSDRFNSRINILKERIKQSETLPKDKFFSDYHLVKFVLVHTLSHILIKELEFLCGYPTTSLNERLFVDDEQMQGLLIYTVAGAEGSYGGIISQADPIKFKKILNSAIFRANDCASDPVCYHSDGQGIGGLNLAACYSCGLLPETSCEEFNNFLDRALLIDSEFGYFP